MHHNRSSRFFFYTSIRTTRKGKKFFCHEFYYNFTWKREKRKRDACNCHWDLMWVYKYIFCVYNWTLLRKIPVWTVKEQWSMIYDRTVKRFLYFVYGRFIFYSNNFFASQKFLPHPFGSVKTHKKSKKNEQ